MSGRSTNLLLCAVALGVLLATGAPASAQQQVRLLPGPLVSLTETSLEQPGMVAAVAWSPWGELYALETPGQRILRFDSNLKLVETAGGFGFEDGSTRGASDLSVAGFEIWVADPPAGRIVRYDRWSAALAPFSTGEDGSSSFSFERPSSVAQAPSGDIALIEKDRQELLLLDPEGRLLERVAGFGQSDHGLRDPTHVEIGADGRIAICDPGRGMLLLLDRFGSLLHEIPWPLEGSGPATVAFYGKQVLMGGASGVVLLSAKGDILMRWGHETTGGPVTDLTIQGSLVALASGSTIRLFTIEEGR